MSHWTKVQTEYTDEDCLMEALKEMYPNNQVVKNTSVRGYSSPERANLVLKSNKNQDSYGKSYDVGFKKTSEGSFVQVADWYGLQWIGGQSEFESKLKQTYAKFKIKRQAKRFGWKVREKAHEDGTIKLTLTKY